MKLPQIDGRKKIVIVGLFVLLVVAGVLIKLFFFKTTEKKIKLSKNEKKDFVLSSDIIKADTFWVNEKIFFMSPFKEVKLKSNNNKIVSKLNLDIALYFKTQDIKMSFNKNMATIENEVLSLLNKKSVEELYDLDDIMLFKNEILDLINNIIGIRSINKIYFINFYVYRNK